MPGAVDPVDPYYAAFDVYLNTSLYEGLSISVLESIAHGCPVVTPPAGGNDEVLTVNDHLVSNASNIEAYVDAILDVVARSERVIPAMHHDPDLSLPCLGSPGRAWDLSDDPRRPRRLFSLSPRISILAGPNDPLRTC